MRPQTATPETATPEMVLAARLFSDLATQTADAPGVTRASFGEGEAIAHALVADVARARGLEVSTDIAGNQYMTWPGRDRRAPRIFIGSHMDSVNHGGNFDGAAGVVAGLAAVSALQDAGFTPAQDIVIMAIRAEELVWFPTPYCGSRMAFGLLDPAEYDAVRRSDTGRTLADHMRAQGCDPDALRAGAKPLDPATIAHFIEVHIEQGPTLDLRGTPVGVVSGIRGNLRYRHGQITGRYAHAGAVAREYRHDAVLAGAEFVQHLEGIWDRLVATGDDFVATVGEFWTDPAMHGMTKVPGIVRFTMDLRSLSNAVLLAVDTELRAAAARIGARRGVTIDPGRFTNAPPALIDPALVALFEGSARALDIPALKLPSGAGHDCATFSWQGVSSGMLFIRNQNGSHNPDEDMQLPDFAQAVQVLTHALRQLAGG
ncbi:hydantoinase/carbamoylase family amidase [Roseicitreum antarcticum]|uniref:N-carbamoyl-L-amino-acid hydrolase n=1 Tax=Roseicitreum antarcticum TaxID=564137 RepID=A0A1H2XPW3_9RHOB|nr:hydantoinase/carbamoylase family amidase [Roseicitreum antarcticum]SDW94952.1 N-carbamoyl-L-amino-acid hydrolase [Roseicitreum antarcticum]